MKRVRQPFQSACAAQSGGKNFEQKLYRTLLRRGETWITE
jgi:hypothetical protein